MGMESRGVEVGPHTGLRQPLPHAYTNFTPVILGFSAGCPTSSSLTGSVATIGSGDLAPLLPVAADDDLDGRDRLRPLARLRVALAELLRDVCPEQCQEDAVAPLRPVPGQGPQAVLELVNG
jgi:hypothetical protein